MPGSLSASGGTQKPEHLSQAQHDSVLERVQRARTAFRTTLVHRPLARVLESRGSVTDESRFFPRGSVEQASAASCAYRFLSPAVAGLAGFLFSWVVPTLDDRDLFFQDLHVLLS